MKIDCKDFRVREGDNVDLEKWPTKVDPVYKSKDQYKSLLEEHVAKLSAMQRLHHASNRHAILLILQATDAAGKDGAIRHVMSGVNPQGCRVYSFKQPTEAELEHDFLWRTRAICRRVGGSRFSTGPITRKCWSCVCITTFYTGRPSRTRRITTRRCGASAIDQSTILKSTSRSTELASSNSFSTSRRRSSANAFSNVSTTPRKTGNSATQM